MGAALNILTPCGKVFRLSIAVLFIIALVSPHRADGAAMLVDETIRNGSSTSFSEPAAVGERVPEASELELGSARTEQQELPERATERPAPAPDSETPRAFARRIERLHRHHRNTPNHRHGSRNNPPAAESLAATRTPAQLHRGPSHLLHWTRHAGASGRAAETPLDSGRHTRQRSRSDRDLNRDFAPLERQPTTSPQQPDSIAEVRVQVTSGSYTGSDETLDHQPSQAERELETVDAADAELLQRERRCVIYADGSGRMRPVGRVKVGRWTPSSPHYVLSMGKRSAHRLERSSSGAVSTEDDSAALTHVCSCNSGLWEDDAFDVCRCWSSHEAHNSTAAQHVLLLEGGARSGRLQCTCTQQSALRVCACGGECGGDEVGGGVDDERLCLELHEVVPPSQHSRVKRDRSLIEALRRRHKPAGTHSRHAPSLYLQSLLNGALG